MSKHSSEILHLAKRGAEVRFRELVDELKILTLSFPHLRDAVDRDDLPVEFILRRGQEKAGPVQAARSRRKMSAKARKAISDAQKARWAKQKAVQDERVELYNATAQDDGATMRVARLPLLVNCSGLSGKPIHR